MAIKKRPLSPRQKMINLMYVVLMAMLALNVSTEIMDGFSVIEESLRRTAQGAARENGMLYEDFDMQMQNSPAKTKAWYDKAQEVRRISDSLCVFTEMLKTAIVKEADGEKGNVRDIQHKEDTEAASQVMLSPTKGKGQELCQAVNDFRRRMAEMVTDTVKRRVIAESLSTETPDAANGKNWQEYMFEAMPASAAVTMLTKLQSDIRHAEGVVLHTLRAHIDEKDIRVNRMEAFVIPETRTVVRGDHFRARIVMAAVDSTHIPDIFIGGEKTSLTDGIYDVTCDRTGRQTLKGYLSMTADNGEEIRRDFSEAYTVTEPSATVSADLMNVLYAGYDNPVSISVPGVPLTSIAAQITGGTLRQTAPGKYIVRPTKTGQEAAVTVYADNNGKKQLMARYTFRVRKLPEPTPFVNIRDDKGNDDSYKGGEITRERLLAATKIGAAVDDGILHIPFRVLSFETVFFDNMGNAVPITSDGNSFSAIQKETIRKMTRGRRMYISRVRTTGPDGTERRLDTSMEVIIR